MDSKLKSLYIDMPIWSESVKVDDFLVAVGKKKSNSVYHVAEIKSVIEKPEKRVKRCYIKVLNSDLVTMLSRDSTQRLITITWYKR